MVSPNNMSVFLIYKGFLQSRKKNQQELQKWLFLVTGQNYK